MQENIELIQKLQKVEAELSNFRLGALKKPSGHDLSDLQSKE